MNKTIIGLAVAAVLVAVGYLALSDGGDEAPVATAPAIEPSPGAAEEATPESIAEDIESGAEDAADSATAALDDATGAAEEAAADAANTATEAAEDAGGALDQALTVEAFDYDRVKLAIEGSELGETEKSTLITALDGARDTPGLLQQVLNQIRTALNV